MRNLHIRSALAGKDISCFVHSFWMLENKTGKDLSSTVLPNGMVDLTVMHTPREGLRVLLRGIDTEPARVVIERGARIFTVGMKLLAVEYLLDTSIKDLPREGIPFPNARWQFDDRDLGDLESFQAAAAEKIRSTSISLIDNRKEKLFDLIYTHKGGIQVKELARQTFWSARQINRYFNQRFGIPVKAYCNLLRLGASFRQLSEGRLFPEDHFSDQNHFIKEVKKYAGVTPKELSKNEGGRFIDITAIGSLPE